MTEMAGVAGFEPTHARVKVLCLTAWLHPFKYSSTNGWGGRIRTYAMLESESNALPLGDTPMKISRFSGRTDKLEKSLSFWGDRRGSNS